MPSSVIVMEEDARSRPIVVATKAHSSSPVIPIIAVNRESDPQSFVNRAHKTAARSLSLSQQRGKRHFCARSYAHEPASECQQKQLLLILHCCCSILFILGRITNHPLCVWFQKLDLQTQSFISFASERASKRANSFLFFSCKGQFTIALLTAWGMEGRHWMLLLLLTYKTGRGRI